MYSIKRNSIALYFFLCPLELVLNRVFTSSTKYVGIVILVLWIIEEMYHWESATLFGTKHAIVLLIWIIYSLIITFTIGDISNETSEYVVTYMMMSILIVICTQDKWQVRDNNLFIDAYYAGSVLMALVIAFYSNSIFTGRSTIMIMGRYCDPNQLAASVLPGAFIAFYKLIEKNSILIKALQLLAFGTVLYAILSTGSRGGLLGLVVGLIILLVNEVYSNRLRIIHIVLLIIAIVIIIKALPKQSLDRLLRMDSYASGSGRIEIWKNLISSFDAKWIMGHGIGSCAAYFLDLYGKVLAVHNTFLLVIYESGFIGFSMYIYLLFDLLYSNISNKKGLVVAILAGAMLNSFFLNSLNLRYLWNGMMLCMMQYNLVYPNIADKATQKYKYIIKG